MPNPEPEIMNEVNCNRSKDNEITEEIPESSVSDSPVHVGMHVSKAVQGKVLEQEPPEPLTLSPIS